MRALRARACESGSTYISCTYENSWYLLAFSYYTVKLRSCTLTQTMRGNIREYDLS